ncbi:T5orf172 domain-containing protein [Litoreibacter ascidiaceicola]|uniref:T5orf172 domain-containing protein n=1 Tax=Litoreibacter ascidiaceicola TaxID=1486859 RepID=A0A1M5A1Q1_9RHOB|nr:GIY-YIG nuclease family protein [Litoreibacter ascidiaceicola]SHF24165.1 T5orf172 domain-containing protein [Litoreibacter ascidiaceicola]
MSDDLDALADDLAEFDIEKKPVARSAVEERIIAGFEDIQRFVDTAGHPPRHGADYDIFERLYAVRLERLAANVEYRALLEEMDRQGILCGAAPAGAEDDDDIDLDALASDLEDLEDAAHDITDLRHVRPVAEKRAAEEVANREACADFDKFKPLFEQVQAELDAGVRATRPFELKAEIQVGSMFIVSGQKAYVAEMGEVYLNAQSRTDARLRVIFDNGTESNLLMRSLQRALHKDDASRRITDPNAGPLFSDATVDGDEASGIIYVLRSKSDLPVVAHNRDLLHKIGVTGGSVKTRISTAKLDPTFLMADVEIVTTYELYNINRVKLENLLHRIFEAARLDIEIKDRFGHPVTPREWFLVPLFAIDEAVERIRDGTIKGVAYDPSTASLK